MINLDEKYGAEKANEIRQNISSLFYGKSFEGKFAASNICDIGTDYIKVFLGMSEEDKIAVVKKDVSECIESLGNFVSRTSMKQLTKHFGDPNRYKEICSYEGQYTAILQNILKLVQKND